MRNIVLYLRRHWKCPGHKICNNKKAVQSIKWFQKKSVQSIKWFQETCPERRAGEPPCYQHCLVSKDYPSGKIFSLWKQKISVIDFYFFTTCVLTVSRILLPTINRHPVNSNHLWWFSVEMKTSHFDFEFLTDIYRNIDASILVRIGKPEGILDFTIDTFNLFFFSGRECDWPLQKLNFKISCLLEGHVIYWFNLVIV